MVHSFLYSKDNRPCLPYESVFLLLYLLLIMFTKVRLQNAQIAFTEISAMNRRLKVEVKCVYK